MRKICLIRSKKAGPGLQLIDGSTFTFTKILLCHSISSKYYFVQSQAEKILQPGPEALEVVAMNSLRLCKWEVLWLLAAWGTLISGLNI